MKDVGVLWHRLVSFLTCWEHACFGKKVYFGCKPIFGRNICFGNNPIFGEKYLFLEHVQNVAGK
jgi:hypothetical protein